MLSIRRSGARVTWQIMFDGKVIFSDTVKSNVLTKADELAKTFGMEVQQC